MSQVENAADRQQVKHASRKEKDRARRDVDDLAALLRLPEFRRFAWRLMGMCCYGENPTRPRGDETHQVIGKQDIARWFLSEMGNAGQLESWLLMQREAWQERRREEVEAEAVRTASASETKAHT